MVSEREGKDMRKNIAWAMAGALGTAVIGAMAYGAAASPHGWIIPVIVFGGILLFGAIVFIIDSLA